MLALPGRQCERCGGYRDPKDTGLKACDCCRCKGCDACELLTELDVASRERDPNWCTWLHCGQFRSGTAHCPIRHLKFKPRISKCHFCVGAESKAKAKAAAEDTPTRAADSVDGLSALQEFVRQQTGAALPDGWRALVPKDAVADAAQTGDFTSPDGTRLRQMASVLSYVQPEPAACSSLAAPVGSTSSTYPSLPALYDMSSPPGVAGAAAAPIVAATDQVLATGSALALAFAITGEADSANIDSAARATTAAASATAVATDFPFATSSASACAAASAAPAPLAPPASSTAACALAPTESASSTARTRSSDLIGRKVALPGTSKHDPADGIVVDMLPDAAVVRWDVANDVRYIPFPEIGSMLLPPPPAPASFAEEQQRGLQSDEQENKRRRHLQSGECCIEHLPPCVREVLTFGQEGDEHQPWGPLQRPADPTEAPPLSNDELMLSLHQSALRTGKPFDPQSIEFDAHATLPAARIRIVLIMHASMPGAVKYEVQNMRSTNAAILGLLGKVTWSGKHMGILKNSQSDGKRRFILFSALLVYFEENNNAADLALCRVVVHRFTLVATYLLLGFRLPPAPHKIGVMLTQWGATDQSRHNDSLGVKDIYSSLLPLMNRGLDFALADGGVHTMNMAVANDAEGIIFESHLKHWGKGAPLPEQSVGSTRSASVSTPLPGFDMPQDGSSSPAPIRIESATIHYYGGKNAMLIPISDKRAELAHHDA